MRRARVGGSSLVPVPVRDSGDPGRGASAFGPVAWGHFVRAYRSTST
ncbi:DUF397 domain-containing protein [Streptomyces sp. NPDC005329]